MTYRVTFVYPYTVLMATVEADPKKLSLDGNWEFSEWEIAEMADELIFEDIGFAPLQHAQDWNVEEL